MLSILCVFNKKDTTNAYTNTNFFQFHLQGSYH